MVTSSSLLDRHSTTRKGVDVATGPGLGTGKVGYWQTGVGVFVVNGDGSFALDAEAELGFTGIDVNAGGFGLSAEADVVFAGEASVEGGFTLDGEANLDFLGFVVGAGFFNFDAEAKLLFEGTFEDITRDVGFFALDAEADLFWFFNPKVGSGRSWVCVKDGVPRVGCLAHESGVDPETGVRKRCNCG